MKAHFFDLDSILVTNAKVWIVDKTVPNIPIIKISQSDFNLIKNGIYKNQGNNLNFNGHTYWIPTDIYEKIKIKSKNYKSDISNLAFSMQEFMNKELIENLEYDINMDVIMHLKNTDDDIYIICSKNTQINNELMISKIEDKLEKNGLKIKKFYHISETFYNRNQDDISHKKVRLLLQHIIGYKTNADKFMNEEIKQYNEVFFYDDDDSTIKLSINCNKLLMSLLSNTESSIKDIIKQNIKKGSYVLIVNSVNGNKVNRFKTDRVNILYNNLITLFQNFKNL